MRARLGMTTLLLLCGVGPLFGQKVPADELKEGFVSLFNGKDFAGWQFDGGDYALPEKLPDNWKVEDGVIKLSGGGKPHCGTQWDYEDFDVRFEWRAMRDKYNSGFYIRSGRKVGANQINLAKGGEGGFIGGKIKGAKTVPELQNKPMEWNDWRVLAVGDKVTFWCNGKLAWEGTELAQKRGHIGLQAEGAPIEFRNLRIKEIGWEPLNDPQAWANGATWKRDGDALAAEGNAAIDTAKKEHKDYVLRLEWKADKGTAGAVALRGGKAEAALVRVGDMAGGSGAIGDGKPAKSADNPLGQWNYLEVRVTGDKATVWQNGVVVADKVTVPAEAGPVGLRSGGVQFRNLRIRESK